MPIFSMTRCDRRLAAAVKETTSSSASARNAWSRTARAASVASPRPHWERARRHPISTDDRLSVTTTMPWGETYGGSTLVDMYLSELVAHAWDLSEATGQTPHCGEDLASAALAAAQAMLRPEYRDMMATGSPFGAEQPAGDGAATVIGRLDDEPLNPDEP